MDDSPGEFDVDVNDTYSKKHALGNDAAEASAASARICPTSSTDSSDVI